MRKVPAFLVTLFFLQQASAQVSDSVVRAFSTYICNCIDTIDMKKPEPELKKAVSLCKTIAITYLLNEKLIGIETLTDEKKAADLDKRSLEILYADCNAIKRLVAAVQNEPSFADSTPAAYFLPASFFLSFGLKPGETNGLLHVYNNLSAGDTKYQRVVDIRWVFATEDDALKWHKAKLKENSEDGSPVKDGVIVEGAKELKVYREGPQAVDMLKAFGISQRHHYFIFVYRNTVSKIFVATDNKTETSELTPFVAAAIEQLKKTVQ